MGKLLRRNVPKCRFDFEALGLILCVHTTPPRLVGRLGTGTNPVWTLWVLPKYPQQLLAWTWNLFKTVTMTLCSVCSPNRSKTTQTHVFYLKGTSVAMATRAQSPSHRSPASVPHSAPVRAYWAPVLPCLAHWEGLQGQLWQLNMQQVLDALRTFWSVFKTTNQQKARNRTL